MERDTALAWLVIGIGLAVAAAQITYLPVEAWDEARRGVNAWEMLARHDYLRYYYLGAPDTFNTKPPLFTWLVALGFHCFGVGVVALRLPSLLALAGFLLYYRHWLARRTDAGTTLLTLGALVATPGIMGYHVGIGGDTDMLFVALLTVACLAAYDYLNETGRARLAISFSCLALAALTKGVAVALVLPGVLVFALTIPAYRARLFRPVVAGAAVAAGLAVGLSLLLMGRYPEANVPYRNLLEATLYRDGLQRLLDPALEPETGPWSVVQALDIRFGPLIYLLYAAVPVMLWRFGVRGSARRIGRDRFAVFSGCVAASVLLLLQLSSNRHNWYVAPAVPFLAYLFARCARGMMPGRPWPRVLIGAAVAYALAGRLFQLGDGARVPDVPELNRAATCGIVYADAQLPQDVVFLLYARLPPGSRVERLGAERDADHCGEIEGLRVCFGTCAPSPK